MSKHVRFIPGNVAEYKLYYPYRTPFQQRQGGFQKVGDRFKTRTSGPVAPEKLAALQKAANDEIQRRGHYNKVEKRGRFTVYYSRKN